MKQASHLVEGLGEAGLDRARARRARGEPGVRVTGLMGPARSLAQAVLASQEEGPTLLVVPDERRAAEAADDLDTFFNFIGCPRTVLPLPALDTDPYRGLLPHENVVSSRARALASLVEGSRLVVLVAPATALLFRTASPSVFSRGVLHLARGKTISLRDVEERLVAGGYRFEDPVVAPGDFARRGGILDVFPPEREQPVRVELEGDLVDEVRSFDAETQRATGVIGDVRIVPVREWLLDGGARARLVQAVAERDKDPRLLEKLAQECFPAGTPFALPLLPEFQSTLFDYLGDSLILLEETGEVERAILSEWELILASYGEAEGRYSPPAAGPSEILAPPEELLEKLRSRGISFHEMEILEPDASSVHLPSQILPSYRGRSRDWIEEVRRQIAEGRKTTVFVPHRGLAERLVEIFQDTGLSAGLAAEEEVPSGAVALYLGDLTRSVSLPAFQAVLFSARDVFSEPPRTERRTARKLGRFLSDFRDLKVGDFVVHLEHGIGVFAGLKEMPQEGGGGGEFVALEYQGGDRLYVPVEKLDALEKYSSSESAKPRIDRLGGTGWEKVKTRVRRSMRDMAQELLQLYAARKTLAGHAFSADTHWQSEFEDLFEHQETPDQIQAIEDVKRDMEQSVPMDRLLCGDVGYGKTEVAMRAAFKAVMDGKQVAVLVPTTVLAFQHLNTFQTRFAPFPVRVDMISRFRSPKEQKAILADLGSGAIDVVIGTHRLLSKDVVFKDLGLLVVDEEQRFGVSHKERLKKLRRNVDALAMTATPIPRTLHMSLAGIRDLSVIETPPQDRLAVQTYLTRWNEKVLAEAIRHELVREGQVYFVHNRIDTVYEMAASLSRLVPEATFGVAHGQMKESDLEKTMLRFIRRELDVLVSTTIIENGLDIPLVNTLIVHRADHFGLAQLYQLRGRVGRSNRRAYAYLLVPDDAALTPVARRRLAAIREFSDLGAGFRIAALDLELRGAGNLLGGEQHGHIEAVGFDLYCKLLEQTVRELSGEGEPEPPRASFQLKIDLRIPESYILDVNQRMSVYKRASSARDAADVERLAGEMRDRYGPLPTPALQLLEYARLRLLAEPHRLLSVEREGSWLAFRFDPASPVRPEALVHLAKRIPRAQLTPSGLLRIPVPEPGPQEILSEIKEVLLELRPLSHMALRQ